MDVIYLIERECKRRNYSEKTIETYCYCVQKFLDRIKKEPRKITRKEIQEYIDFLVENKASGSTVNVYVNALKFLMEEILNKRVLLRIKYSKTPKRLPVVLTKEEVMRLIGVIENPKHKLLIELMYSAGLRVSELVHLKIQDLELEKNFGWVRSGKGKKDRLFIIARCLKENLIDYIALNNLDYYSWLFLGRKGRNIHQASIRAIVKKAAKDAKINKNVHCHTLRHSFATHLIENNYDLMSVQNLLGHSSSKTTMVYVHVASPSLINIKSPLDELKDSSH